MAAHEDSWDPVDGQTLRVYRSDDHGTTWQGLSDLPAPVYLSDDPKYAKYISNLTNPYLYVLPEDIGDLTAGTLLLASVVTGEDQYFLEQRAADPDWIPSDDGDRSDMAIALYSSTGEGASWSVENIIATGGWQGGLAAGEPWVNDLDGAQMSYPYTGQPYFVSEYGGIWWNPALVDTQPQSDPDRDESWGYGDRVRSVEEWYERFAGLTKVLLTNPDMFGYCYTQLTDTFQEENGIYDFERRPKFDIARIREVQTATAAYEEPPASAGT